MWWRFLTFCVLVTIVLFIVLSCIHGRPVIHLFFHRCCEDNIENDQVIFENFGDNYLRERLIGGDILVFDNSSYANDEDVKEVIKVMRDKLNVHDPKARRNLTLIELVDDVLVQSAESGEFTTKRTEVKPTIDKKSERLIHDALEDFKKLNEDSNNDVIKGQSPITKDAISKLKSIMSGSDNTKDAVRDLEIIINESGKLSPEDGEFGELNIDSTTELATSTEETKTTTVQNEIVKPEIKQAPPLDETIMSDMHDNDSIEI